ncbi:unnamed protein product [Dovyalis caffra]|uniref:Uncharacterized protein n=1 Tax=Dovyalis caffra TaxID=77055 RepID=A0AAV1QLH4_9ROSI|nr:unnamed protein product [Dovyalis caffra]
MRLSHQPFVAAQQEAQRFKAHIRSIQTESDIQIRVLLDKIAKMEKDIRAGVTGAVENPHRCKEYQICLPSLRNSRHELKRLRATFEYEKGLNIEKVEQMRAMEQNLIGMAREMDKLGVDVLNAKTRARAPNRYVGGCASLDASGPPPVQGGGTYIDGHGRPLVHIGVRPARDGIIPYSSSNGPVSNVGFDMQQCLLLVMLLTGVIDRLRYDLFEGWKSLLSLAIPSCILVCLEWWWYEIMILLCGLLLNARATVASMGILIQTTGLIYIFPSSLSFGVSTRVGNELGANNPQKAKLAAIVGLSSRFVLGFTALRFAVTVRKVWVTMFTEDAKIIALASMVLPIIGLCELGNCSQTRGCGVLRGMARHKVGANINLGCFYLVVMPVAVWLSFYASFDFKGLWFGLLAAQAHV